MKQLYLLTLYAERMNTSTAKIISNLLDNVLPAFDEDTSPKDGMVRVRLPIAYRAMESADVLQAVNEQEVKERFLNKGNGDIGRPRKAGKHQG